MGRCYYYPMVNHRSTPEEWFGQGLKDRPASQRAVLDYVWGMEEFTATDVMAGTQLTRATVIDALSQLVEAGLVLELANARQADAQDENTAHKSKHLYRKGRPARRFAFRPEAGIVIGIDAGYTHLAAIAADLAGNTVASLHTLSGRGRDADNTHAQSEVELRKTELRSLIEKVVDAAGRSLHEVFALCVAVPAPVSEDGTSPAHPTGFWQRVNPDLLQALADIAPVVRIENDALLAAVAEGTVGAAQGCRNYVTVLGGARMGSGVVIDGKLLRGAHGAVGEMNAFDYVRGVGDSRGLADYAAFLAAQKVATGKIGGAFAGLEPEEVTGRLVFDAIEAGDLDAIQVSRQVGERLARIVGVLQSFYDPEKIVVSGAVGPAMEQVIEAARAAMPGLVGSITPELLGSQLGAEAVVTGAVSAGVHIARSRALDIVLR